MTGARAAWAAASLVLALSPVTPVAAGAADRPPAIGQATLAEADAVTPEVSTEELAAILAAGSRV